MSTKKSATFIHFEARIAAATVDNLSDIMYEVMHALIDGGELTPDEGRSLAFIGNVKSKELLAAMRRAP